MKLPALLLAILALPALAVAGFKVPSKVYELSDLEKAKAEAQKQKKPIAILYSNKDSTCPLCSNASEEILRELGNKTVMIYTNSWAALPPSAQSALREGKYIPKVAVLDSSLDRPLGMVTYEAIKEDPRKAFREVKKAIAEYKK